MYSLRQIRKGLRLCRQSPRIVPHELNRVYHEKRHGPGYNRRGIDVMAEDWDTLVILDACRYDLFERHHTFPGRLESRISRASHTREFLKGNFDGGEYLDTVYTTASPQLESWNEEIDVEFYAVNNVWNSERWDDEVGTVRPEDMTEAGLEAIEEHPNKRHIVHYMQPHYPFIGSDIDEGVDLFEESLPIWRRVFFGTTDVDPEELWRAYRENFERALDPVNELIEEIEGRTVVTSDHGNLFGERARPIPISDWGHPRRLWVPELVRVPWLVYEEGERREVHAEASAAREAADEDVVEDRLRNLGYA